MDVWLNSIFSTKDLESSNWKQTCHKWLYHIPGTWVSPVVSSERFSFNLWFTFQVHWLFANEGLLSRWFTKARWIQMLRDFQAYRKSHCYHAQNWHSAKTTMTVVMMYHMFISYKMKAFKTTQIYTIIIDWHREKPLMIFTIFTKATPPNQLVKPTSFWVILAHTKMTPKATESRFR